MCGRLLSVFIALVLLVSPSRAQTLGPAEAGVFEAVRSKDHAALRSALANVPEPASLVDHVNRTPLELACNLEDAESVRILLQAGIPVERAIAGRRERPPLSTALQKGNSTIVALLLDAGAPVAARDSFGYTPFDIACQTKNDACATLLFDALLAQNAAYTPIPSETIRAIDQALCAAARSGDLGLTQKLLDAGAGVNAIEHRRYTPLICAVLGKSPAVVDLVLKRGGDPAILLDYGRTSALRVAIQANTGSEIVSKILDRYPFGAPELSDSGSHELWIWPVAVEANDGGVLRLLLAKDLDPTINGGIHDLLEIAIASSSEQSVEVLLEAGVVPGHARRSPRMTHVDLAREQATRKPSPESNRIVELLEAVAMSDDK